MAILDTDNEDESPPPLQALPQETRSLATPIHLTQPALRPIIKISSSDVSGLTTPKSQYSGWKPPLPVTPEAVAISSLMVRFFFFFSLSILRLK